MTEEESFEIVRRDRNLDYAYIGSIATIKGKCEKIANLENDVLMGELLKDLSDEIEQFFFIKNTRDMKSKERI